MKITLKFNAKDYSSRELVVMTAFCKKRPQSKGDNQDVLVNSHWPSAIKKSFDQMASSVHFQGTKNSIFQFFLGDGRAALALGFGEKKHMNYECLRRAFAKVYESTAQTTIRISVVVDDFIIERNWQKSLCAMAEGLWLSSYIFGKYRESSKVKLREAIFEVRNPSPKERKMQEALNRTKILCDNVNICRDLVNEPPNILTSSEYSKRVLRDVKDHLKRVKVKVLSKAELKRENMHMFLSVNAGSAHPPQLVHLTYTPKKATKKTKHIALVGKGLTFDTGGYSIKPSPSMIGMKFDMAGSATVYAAFRAAVLTEAPVKISCFLGITDNAINEHAVMPDSIIKSRKGKTVEILNTDAEGRLVLGDVLDYASSYKPDVILDAATLTGACLVSLGQEVCGLMGNNKKLNDLLKETAKETDEYIWELPIIDEWRKDMESSIADLKNIGGNHFAGTSKAAAFLENFIGDNIAWAHLDIAGIANSQSHLPYCPKKGASGMMVRTLFHYLHRA